MEIIILVLVVLILFFVLRTNYKLSEHEEKTRKIVDNDLKKFTSINEELLQRITSIENKISFYQNQFNDLMSENTSQNNARNRKFAKELDQIKTDTDIIKSIYLRRSVGKAREDETNSTEAVSPKPVSQIKKPITNIPEKKTKIEKTTVVEKQQKPKKTEEIKPEKTKKVEKQISTEEESFKSAIVEKIDSFSIDDVWILKQIFIKPHGVWFNGSEIEDEQSKIIYAMPKISRKLIVDGVPIIRIKTIRDKMMIMWGESLTDSKVEIVLQAIRGEM